MQSYVSKVFSLSTGKLIKSLLSIVTVMIFSRLLTKVELSTYRQTMLAYNFATPLLTLGIPSTIFYFLPGAKKRERGIVIDNMTILFLAGAVFTIFLYFGGTDLLAKRFNNPDLSRTLRWIIFYPLYTFPALALPSVLIIYGKVKLAAVFEIITNLVMAIFLLMAVVLTSSFELPLQIKIFFPLFTFPLILYLVFSTVKKGFDLPRVKEMTTVVKYGVPFGFSSIIAVLSLQLDKIIVSSMCGPEEFAVYSNGAMEVPLVAVVTGSISTIIISDMRKYCSEKNEKSALKLFRSSAIKSAMILLPVMCFLMFFSDAFVEIMFSEKYLRSAYAFRIYLLVLPIRIAHYGSAFLALGLNREMLWKTAGNFIINIGLSIVLVNIIGSLGAALATIISLYFWSVPLNLFLLGKGFFSKPLKILPFRDIGKILTVSFYPLIVLIPAKMFIDNVLIQFFISLVIYLLIYSYLSYRYIPSAQRIIDRYAAKFLKKKVSDE